MSEQTPAGSLGPAHAHPADGLEGTFDALDLHVAQAVCAQVLGFDGDHVTVRAAGPGQVQVAFSTAALWALVAADSGEVPDLDGWVLLAETDLIEGLVETHGELWRPEAEMSVAWALACRASRLTALAQAATHGPVPVDVRTDARTLLSVVFPDASLATLG